MRLSRLLAAAAVVAGLGLALPDEAQAGHRHHRSCGHSSRYDRSYRYDHRPYAYGYRPYAYAYRPYAYGYAPPPYAYAGYPPPYAYGSPYGYGPYGYRYGYVPYRAPRPLVRISIGW
jgi:hypothetical protein